MPAVYSKLSMMNASSQWSILQRSCPTALHLYPKQHTVWKCMARQNLIIFSVLFHMVHFGKQTALKPLSIMGPFMGYSLFTTLNTTLSANQSEAPLQAM